MTSQVLRGRWGYASVTDKIADIVLARRTHWVWALGFGVAGTLTLVLIGGFTIWD